MFKKISLILILVLCFTSMAIALPTMVGNTDTLDTWFGYSVDHGKDTEGNVNLLIMLYGIRSTFNPLLDPISLNPVTFLNEVEYDNFSTPFLEFDLSDFMEDTKFVSFKYNGDFELWYIGDNFDDILHWQGDHDLSHYREWGDDDCNTAPVPEPATMLLLGTGLMGMGTLSRKKFIKKRKE